MQAIAWSNGQGTPTGAGYGLRISAADRDRWFDRAWTHVVITLEGSGIVTVPISASFWRSCIELRSTEIGRWLLSRHLAPWPKGKPPMLTLRPINSRKFDLLPPAIG